MSTQDRIQRLQTLRATRTADSRFARRETVRPTPVVVRRPHIAVVVA